MAPHRHDPPEVPPVYAWHHGPSLRALGRTLAHDAYNKLPWAGSGASLVTAPGPVLHEVVQAHTDALLHEYIMWSGARSEAYTSTVPPPFFFQWSFPAMQKVCNTLPFPLTRLLIQGCKLEVRHTVPRHQELFITAQLREVIEADGKVKITVAIETGAAEHPDAISAEVYMTIPLPRNLKHSGSRSKSEVASVPSSASVIATHNLSRRCGLDCAYVIGDFNPIHCSVLAARASGFQSTILQGFGQLSLVFEDLVRAKCGGDPMLLNMLNLRFVGNVLLPREIYVSVDEAASEVMGGDRPGGRAASLGTFEVSRGPRSML